MPFGTTILAEQFRGGASNLLSSTSTLLGSPAGVGSGSPVPEPVTSSAYVTSTIPESIIQKQIRRLRTYYSEYFSGAQVKIYLNDVRLEAISIGWNASQQKTPIYGYASETFDAVLKGNFLVNGEFSLAFKESAYMNAIHEHVKNKSVDQEVYASNLRKIQSIPKDRLLSILSSANAAVSPLVAATQDEEGTKLVLSDSTIEEILGAPLEFKALAEALEDSIWNLNSFRSVAGKQARNMLRPDQMDYVNLADRLGIPYTKIGEGFNLLITYGNVENIEASSTVKSITNVHITSSSQSIDMASGFIIETYSFFAKGLDEPVGAMRGFIQQAGDVRVGSAASNPIFRSFRVDISSGVNPTTLEVGTKPELEELKAFITDSINKVVFPRISQTSRMPAPQYSIIQAVLMLPLDWTESNPSGIADLNPAARKLALRSLAENLVENYLKIAAFGQFGPPGNSSPVQYIIEETGAALNEILINIEVR